MKTFVAALALLTTTAALANNPAAFTGRYRVEHGQTCMRDVGTRAYINVSDYSRGVRGIRIEFYSSENVTVEIPTQNARNIPAGTPNITSATTVRWASATSLVASIRTRGTSYGQGVDYTTEYTLTRAGNRVTLVERGESGDAETCVMTKY